MGHLIKGQRPREYLPRTTRRVSGLSPVRESSENALKRWNKLRQYIKSTMKLERNIRTKGSVTRGRFKMSNASPSPKKKNKSPEVYKRGRFKLYSS
jgi:hypothetical protein